MSEYVLHEIDFIDSHKLSHLNYLISRDSSGETLIILARFSFRITAWLCTKQNICFVIRRMTSALETSRRYQE